VLNKDLRAGAVSKEFYKGYLYIIVSRCFCAVSDPVSDPVSEPLKTGVKSKRNMVPSLAMVQAFEPSLAMVPATEPAPAPALASASKLEPGLVVLPNIA